MKKYFFVATFILLILISAPIIAQPTVYTLKFSKESILDPVYGITKYNPLIKAIGGDSVRFSGQGKPVQDWIEDYYTTGKLLHRGFYIDGKLRVFRNYYEDGAVERIFKITGSKGSEMSIFFPDGKNKSLIEYVGEIIVKQQDFYPNGKLEYEEENSKDGDILWKKISYFENGNIDNSLEVTNKGKKLFRQREFYESGKIKVDGEMKFNKGLSDYQKDGIWNYYDEDGKLIKTEKYYKGQLED